MAFLDQSIECSLWNVSSDYEIKPALHFCKPLADAQIMQTSMKMQKSKVNHTLNDHEQTEYVIIGY